MCTVSKESRTVLFCVAAFGVALILAFALARLPKPDSPVLSVGSCTPTVANGSTNPDDRPHPLLTDLLDFPGADGRVSVRGTVRSAACAPRAGVLVKFWAAREGGEYTEASYGSVYSDEDGRYMFSVPMPLAYPGASAPPHVHIAAEVDGVWVATEVFPDRTHREFDLELVPVRQEPENVSGSTPLP